MEPNKYKPESIFFRNTPLQLVIFLCIIILIINLNAIVDSILHPEIPYFDHEHIIVGGISGLVNSLLFGLVILYARNLEQALSKIGILESFLPICCNCKKIRTPDACATQMESWQAIETYFTEKTNTQFSHSICPDCKHKLYPELTKKDADKS